MKIKYLLIFISLMQLNIANAQTFSIDTLRYKGDINKYINFVIMGDGYTSAQQGDFITDATNLSNYFLGRTPWSNYENYINVFAIEVISFDSGVKHPQTASDCSTDPMPVSNPNNYFGSTFDYYGIHRLVCPVNTANIANVLAANFPNYDQILIVVNTPHYGGSGGSGIAVSTMAPSAYEITAHEIGHSFANLADEYYAGDMYANEAPNMTQETNPLLVKWKNWMGFNGVGIFQHCCGGNSALWYKPTSNSCKMEALNYPYCSVCTQTIVESIHSIVNPIVSYTPITSVINSSNQFINFKLTELMKPVLNTLNINWKLDGNDILNNVDSIQIDQNILTNGTHFLTVKVTDTSSFLRVDQHSSIHFSTVTWTIEKTTTGLDLTATDNKINCSVYPNPSSGNILNVSIDLEKRSNVIIDLASSDGKIIQHIANKTLDKGMYLNTINVEKIINGAYLVIFQIGNVKHTEIFVKQ